MRLEIVLGAFFAIIVIALVATAVFFLIQPSTQLQTQNSFEDLPPFPPDFDSSYPPLAPNEQTSQNNQQSQPNEIPPLPQ